MDAIKINKKAYEGKLHLRIGGNGEVDKLKTIIKANKLENLVTFIGWTSGEKKIQELNNANVYILPSYNEGLPISILEALSYNCPIISTPVGGIPEVVKSNLNGILVEPGNIDEISGAINYFIENQDCLNEFGLESGNIVKDFYPEKVLAELQIIYKGLI